METLSKVRAKIIEAVPEITEVKTGCRLKIRGGLGEYKRAVYIALDAPVNGKVRIVGIGGIEYPKLDLFDIIGRPITLADVLRAIENNTKVHWLNSMSPAETLSNHQEGLWGITKDLLHKWNLSLPLDEQEPEVIEFLAEVLGV